jgi:DNA sulfur modification protein DndD
VILDELVLHNVGTFAGRQAITLAPARPDKPVVLIGGLNGVGKTTLLEAIHLAFYGALAQPSGRRSGSYESYLAGLIHRGVPVAEGARIELAFHAYQQGTERHYRICRMWRGTAKSAIRERLDVEVDGRVDRALSSTWSEYVETFLPRGIAGLFFFDGEQIEALADLERSRHVLGTALAALLGLDLVQRLEADLSVLRRRYQARHVPDELRAEVDARGQAVTVIRQAEADGLAAVAAARVDVERAEKALFGLTEQYRSAGGGLLERREAAVTRLSLLRDQLHRTEEELRDELSGAAPLIQASLLLPALARQAHNEAAATRERNVADVVATRDYALIERLRDAKIDTNAISDIVSYLAADRDERRRHADVPNITGLQSPTMIDQLIDSALPDTERRLRVLLDRRQESRAEIENAERLLAAIPDPESLAPLAGQRDIAAAELSRAQAVMRQAEERLAELRKEGTRASATYEAAMERAAHATLAADDNRRLVEHIDRTRATLQELQSATASRHLTRISSLVLEALRQLLRKESLITGVTIDPTTQTVELAGHDGRTLSAQELSAGERQLLAVALLWGLARASGQPLPVVIDTPLGRLDGSHRQHLLERYFPRASHQVILLATDTEIDEEAYQRLLPHIGRVYRLEFDPTANATTVQRGYFWE